jgi:hypothetical protein
MVIDSSAAGARHFDSEQYQTERYNNKAPHEYTNLRL